MLGDQVKVEAVLLRSEMTQMLFVDRLLSKGRVCYNPLSSSPAYSDIRLAIVENN